MIYTVIYTSLEGSYMHHWRVHIYVTGGFIYTSLNVFLMDDIYITGGFLYTSLNVFLMDDIHVTGRLRERTLLYYLSKTHVCLCGTERE